MPSAKAVYESEEMFNVHMSFSEAPSAQHL